MEPIERELTIAAPLEWVWWAWTGPERITRWFAPEARIEPHVDGAFELFWNPTDHDHDSTKGCTVTALEPMRMLGFTWRGPDHLAEVMNHGDALTQVLVRLEAEPSGTRVHVTHGGWGDGEGWSRARQWHEAAWDQVLGSLKTSLEGGEGELCCAPEAEGKD
ncbi:SRPBCC family protein [Limnochorda pilosa]|uniref:Activator of Hsp90 ATPase homologue 1/2-like C-terminal domain-containing protein n=1 Tax=Limnochorda pilosa TaxID=1555112 RepID=A0A0K2SL00_LIMPI|nr:SRPBCC domain-containing protein [Limnochorda pilosa]BAS27672.1 hypothetical protein LIP_1828 [Limnochorda pilosa]